MSANYYTGDGLGFQHLGQEGPPASAPVTRTEEAGTVTPATGMLGRLAAIGGTLSMPVLAYHGYKRNDSIGWAFVWGFFGSWVWPITVPIAFAQGFAKSVRGVRGNRRRATARRRRGSRRRRTSRRMA